MNPLELLQITGDDNQASTARMTRDHQVIRPNHTAPPLEIAPYLRRVRRRLTVKWQHCQPAGKMLDLAADTRRVIRSSNAPISLATAASLGKTPEVRSTKLQICTRALDGFILNSI